jgi:uncharacterized protein YhhL (DUF1145 family)
MTHAKLHLAAERLFSKRMMCVCATICFVGCFASILCLSLVMPDPKPLHILLPIGLAGSVFTTVLGLLVILIVKAILRKSCDRKTIEENSQQDLGV